MGPKAKKGKTKRKENAKSESDAEGGKKEKVAGGAQKEKVADGAPKEKVADGASTEKVADGASKEKLAVGDPKEKVAAGAPKEKVAVDAPKEKVSARAKKEKGAARAKKEKVAVGAPKEKASPRAKKEKVADGAPKEKVAARAKKEKVAVGAPKEKVSPRAKKEKGSPRAKKEKGSPEAKKEKGSPRAKKEKGSPRAKKEKGSPKAKKEKGSPKAKKEKGSPKAKKEKGAVGSPKEKVSPRAKKEKVAASKDKDADGAPKEEVAVDAKKKKGKKEKGAARAKKEKDAGGAPKKKGAEGAAKPKGGVKKEKVKKGGKKGKAKISAVPQKEYQMLTLEEVHDRERKYTQHMTELKVILHFIDEALDDVELRKEARDKLGEWESYVTCDGIPKPFSPPDIRLFFVKLRYFESEDVDNTIDWLLSVNERSILSQDIFRKDLTAKTLVNKIRPNFGEKYNENIDLGLRVLKDIEYFMDDKKKVATVSDRIIQDVKEQITGVEQEVLQFLDRLTYRILCSENAYMEQIDAITAEYFYAGNNFEIHIWTLKHVPILFDRQDYPSMIAQLHQLKVQVQLPFSVLKDDLTMRAIHMNFDHFSEHAKSFEQQNLVPIGNCNGGITEMIPCLLAEWAMQVQIQNEVRNKMITLRSDFEEKQRIAEEESNKKGKERGQRVNPLQKKKDKNAVVKPKKGPREPPIITENVYPDIWDDFIEQEQRQFDDFVNAVYHPSVLKLTEKEINMKKFIILGGIYQIYFVSKPQHFNFDTFTMTWHVNNGNLFIDKDLKADLLAKSEALHRRVTLIQSALTATDIKRRSTFVGRETETKLQEEDKFTKDLETSPYFVVTFELPPFLCLWGEPIPCHFEADVIGFVESEFDLHPQGLKTTGSSGHIPGSSFTSEAKSAKQQKPDADTTGVSSNLNSVHTSVSSEHRPASLRLGGTSISTSKVQLDSGGKKSDLLDTDALDLKDFNINLPMTKLQIRNIQRHCIPRFISSFKFPVEILEEDNEETRNKPKGKGGTLVRKRTSEGEANEVTYSERIFSYQNQNNPERLFPIFPKVEPLVMPYKPEEVAEMIGQYEPETFFELIEALDFVKKHYRSKNLKFLEVPVMISKLRDVRARQRQQRIQSINFRPTVIPDYTRGRKSSAKGAHGEKRKSRHERRSTRLTMLSKSSEEANETDDNVSMISKQSAEIELPPPIEKKTFKFSHWTREHIFHSVFDKKNCKITIWTDRLGTLGFAYKRYEHFPFRYWSLEPSEENPETEVILKIDTQFARCIIYITAEGYRGYVTDFSTGYVRFPVKYLEIQRPLMDLKEFKKRFREKHINIFSGHDARFYIENGYFSEKHMATELHNYTCMAIHCATIRFRYSSWNRLAQRRDMIFKFAHMREPEENFNTVRITPENGTFVEVKELCSDNLDEFKLQYTLTWRSIDNYADLHSMIASTYPAAVDQRMKDSNTISCVRNLLREIRPLSYS